MRALLTSRKFWALVIGLAVLLLGQVFPAFALDEEAAVGLVIVVVSYIVGVAVDPGPGGWAGVVQSRKFWTAAVGLVVLVLNGFGIGLPDALPQETIIWLCITIGAYISGVALEYKAAAG